MNISQKCNCCLKQSVCKYSIEYQLDCERLKQSIQGDTTEISIKCKEFIVNKDGIREKGNERV